MKFNNLAFSNLVLVSLHLVALRCLVFIRLHPVGLSGVDY